MTLPLAVSASSKCYFVAISSRSSVEDGIPNIPLTRYVLPPHTQAKPQYVSTYVPQGDAVIVAMPRPSSGMPEVLCGHVAAHRPGQRRACSAAGVPPAAAVV